MSCRRYVRALSCGMAAVMDENVNENEREGAVLKSAMRLVAPSSRTVPLSKWSAPSLVVLRALEMAGVSSEPVVPGAFYPLNHIQAAPVLSMRWGTPRSSAGILWTGQQVAALVACGAVVDPGVASPDGGGVRYACLRFTVGGHSEEIVAGLARSVGSSAQSELDRRERENEHGSRRSGAARPVGLAWAGATQMSAGDVLDALEKAWKESALAREPTITDTRELYRELEKGERHGPLKRRIDALMFSP